MYNKVNLKMKVSDLNRDSKEEVISLNGITKENSLYFENVELTIEEDNILRVYDLNMQGYLFDLTIIDDEIFVIGKTNNILVGKQIKYKNKKLKIINQNENILKLINSSEKYRTLKNKLDIKLNLPNEARIISLDKVGGKNNIIVCDLDNDMREEIIFAYNYLNRAYICIGRYNDNNFRLIDIYEGRGYDISNLYIRPIINERSNTIIIGWSVSDSLSNLDLLLYDENKLKSVLNKNDMYFSKIDLIDFDKNNKEDIVLLRHDLDEYYIKAYEYNHFNLIENSLYTNIYKNSIKI